MCSLGNFLSLSHCFCPAVLARALASEAFQPRLAGDPAVEEVGDSQRVARQGTDMKVTGLRPGLGKDRADQQQGVAPSCALRSLLGEQAQRLDTSEECKEVAVLMARAARPGSRLRGAGKSGRQVGRHHQEHVGNPG